jgi:N-acetylneuraminic acid mutarotase
MKTPILAFLCALSTALLASGQVPSLINYQGRLTDANGAAVTGSKNFSIDIFDAATGGNLLYSETIGAVTLDSNGVYSFQFGSAGTSNKQVTETIGTTAGTTLVYSKALANSSVVNNSITVTDGTNSWSQSVGNPGAGATATANTIVGFVIGATITNGGSGYTSAPTVTISGNGTGATATATLTDGVVTGINVTSAGSGYTTGATITIAPPVIPFRVEYASGTITATYASAPTAGRTIAATYRYGTGGIADALGNASEQWMAITVDGVTQGARQRVLAVPFALNSQNSLRSAIATTVDNGAITVDKIANGALTDATSREGHVIMTTQERPDLEVQGFAKVGLLNLSTSRDIKDFSGDAPRSAHTAVWTGSEMIIWGGINNNAGTLFNSGARYNATNDTWSTMSTTNAPGARQGHVGVWTGSKMIIWGGYNMNSQSFNSGGIYDPVNNTWTATSTTGAPVARSNRVGIWTGSEMIVWGGDSFTFDGGRYNPTSNTWTTMSNVGAAPLHFGSTVVWTGQEMIIWGGNSGGINYNTGARYNPVTNNWVSTSTSGAPSARYQHTATWTGQEMIIWGGSGGLSLNTGGRYNPTNNTWATTSTNDILNLGRQDHTAVWTGNEMIIWGGSTGQFLSGIRYNPSRDTWNILRPNSYSSLYPRVKHTAVWTGNSMIVYGGQGGNSGWISNPEIITPKESFLYAKP